MRIILLVQMKTIVVVMAAAVMAILISIVAVGTTIAVTDNNTNAGTRGGANDRQQCSH